MPLHYTGLRVSACCHVWPNALTGGLHGKMRAAIDDDLLEFD